MSTGPFEDPDPFDWRVTVKPDSGLRVDGGSDPGTPSKRDPEFSSSASPLAARLVEPPLEKQEDDQARVGPLKAGADRQDLPQSNNRK